MFEWNDMDGVTWQFMHVTESYGPEKVMFRQKGKVLGDNVLHEWHDWPWFPDKGPTDDHPLQVPLPTEVENHFFGPAGAAT